MQGIEELLGEAFTFRSEQTYFAVLCSLVEAYIMLPILYSFRRCPYAIRARMALLYTAQKVELREVFLQDKPPCMLRASPKGTVPVLLMPDGGVIDESIDVMHWSLESGDPDNWWKEESAREVKALIEENDFEFKQHLDHYKYWQRFPAQSQSHYRAKGEKFLQLLERSLNSQSYLIDDKLGFADVAIFPFVRQFAFVDKPWFDQAPYCGVQNWLQKFLESQLFRQVMTKLPAWRRGDVPTYFPQG